MTEMPVILPSVSSGFPQTFPSHLDRAVLPVLEKELQSGRRGCFSAFEPPPKASATPDSNPRRAARSMRPDLSIRLACPQARWFLNLNTAEDLRAARGSPPATRRVSCFYGDVRFSPHSRIVRVPDSRDRRPVARLRCSGSRQWAICRRNHLALISFSHVSMWFGERKILDNVSFSVDRGETCAFSVEAALENP